MDYFLGLDIGTDSVGYAVTDKKYDLMKKNGEKLWGVTLFDAANTSAERRSFRTSRRRLQRKKQRVYLLQELFAEEINKTDPGFFIRIKTSALLRKDKEDAYSIFDDEGYTDSDYHNQYPTIHHLICALMNEDKAFDVRIVYLAISWLVKHRGHFLSEVSKENVAKLKEFKPVYDQICNWFNERDYHLPVGFGNQLVVENIMKQKLSASRKYEQYKKELLDGKKPAKSDNELIDSENFIKLLCGSKLKINDIFKNQANDDNYSLSLSSDDSVIAEIISMVSEDNAMLIQAAKALYDWTLLTDILKDMPTISDGKVREYQQHKEDLYWLKDFIKKYCPKNYHDVFKEKKKEKKNDKAKFPDYSKYAKTNYINEEFFKELAKLLKSVTPDESDMKGYNDALSRIESGSFLPKQVNTDNRVIPYQLYWYELDRILKQAESYLPFLISKDDNGLTVSDKIRSIFEFRVPYFVGPLNGTTDPKTNHSWFKRKAEGKIYPWNIETIIDYDESENEFIKRMTGTCTYIPGEDVLPKGSLLYHKFMVLNEINNLKIDDVRINSVELKQKIYNDLFLQYKKVTKKKLEDYLVSNGYMSKESKLSGIDEQIHSDLKPQHDFKRLLNSGILSEEDAEEIILRITVTEDRKRIVKWLKDKYPELTADDIKYISRIKYNDFGKLSLKFLNEIEGASTQTGEISTIISALWNTNCNLMELLSDKFTFSDTIKSISNEYYSENPRTIAERLDEMYISNSVKRPIIRAIEIVKDVTKAMKGTPDKIFVEMPRGGTPEQKNKRTISRKQQILSLYDKCEKDTSELRRQLEEMSEQADSRLQSKTLFLYYMQLGKCMYTGNPIDLSKLSSDYNIDHIYPRAYVKDDSILNNLVLVESKVNGDKGDTYPIKSSIREIRKPFWNYLRHNNFITEEKYKRLTRSTEFSDDEKWGFINRQITETSQSAKAITVLLKELYPETEIVYVKAGLVSDFRQEFKLLKSRIFNDLHHAKDAYLNIVVGNVYNSRFTKQWFMKNRNHGYSIKLDTLFKNEVKIDNNVVWAGDSMLSKIKKVMADNHAHMTIYSYFKKGGFFDQMPVSKRKGLVPRKKGLDPCKYGGYNGLSITGYMLVKYRSGKKFEIMIMPIPLISLDEFKKGKENIEIYVNARLRELVSKPVDSVSFPLGMRLLKINTMFSADGYRFCVSGSTDGKIIVYSFMAFNAPVKWNNYIKALETLNDKYEQSPDYYFNQQNEQVNADDNIELYDFYIDKLKNSVYKNRPTRPLDILINGRDTFINLPINKQVASLLKIHTVFGRLKGGCDLKSIGGSANSAKSTLNMKLSNWAKCYTDVRIIDSSPSGIWEKKSPINLIELL